MRGSFMRKDWADQLGIAVGQTDYGAPALSVEEIHSAMTQFVAANLDGAPAGQVWGMSNYGTTYWAMLPLLEAFYDQSALTDEVAAVYPSFMWPNAKEGYRFVNQLFNEGLVYPDFALISER
jgi:putative aldouronate transport system substrate-binding protein